LVVEITGYTELREEAYEVYEYYLKKDDSQTDKAA
jgi:hypothetical protein